jgi:sensor domain CHASE-containing protein
LNDQQKKVRIIIICSVSVLFIIITLLTWFFLLSSNIDTEKLVKKEIKVFENSVYRQLNNSITQLQALAKYVQHNPNVSRDDFEHYVSQQTALTPSIKAMSWNPMIDHSEISTHEDHLEKIHSKSISITGNQLEDNVSALKSTY